MECEPTIPAPPSVEDIESIADVGSARLLLKQLVAMIATLTTLVGQLRDMLEAQRQETEQLKRALFGQKSERMVPADREIKKKRRENETDQERQARLARARDKRRENAEKRQHAAREETVHHELDTESLPCGCTADDLMPLGPKTRYEWEFVPAHFLCRIHEMEHAVCPCGRFHQAQGPARVVEGTHYGPGLHAHAVVSKCADSLPIYRLAKQFARAGVPVSQSVLNEIFHRSAEILRLIAHRLLELVAAQSLVHADETRIAVQNKRACRKAFIWVFIAQLGNAPIVAYRYSASRSGQTPIEVLQETTGYLHVDAYSGYNAVTTPDSRTRIGCWAHGRRKFFDAKGSAPKDAERVLDWIRQLYEVEYDAAEAQALGTERHLAMRRARSRPVIDALFKWIEAEYPSRRPKSPIGKAMKYLINQRESLERFLENPKIRLDNNIAENHLRLIALGRKNFLFVGHDEAGENLAILQTIVSTCIANGVNPQDYLTDVLIRVQTHPHSAIDELLPHNWKPPPVENMP